jgi:hypothetical protein
MNTIKKLLPAIALFFLASCGGKPSAESIAKKWCTLNAKFKSATNDSDKEAAKEARRSYEKEIEAKYKPDEQFMSKLKELTQACD